MIYADNAATTKPSYGVLHAIEPYLKDSFANPSSTHPLGLKVHNSIENSRKTISNILNCNPEEIIFTSGGTESNNQIIINVISSIGKDKHIITSKIEHHSVLNNFKTLENLGYDITYLDVDENGFVTPESIEDAIKDNTGFVSVMYANNEIGTIQPIKEIGAICKKHNILFMSDCVQAVGHVPINLKELNVDYISFSAHKFGGIKGTGVLYHRQDVPISFLLNGGGQENGYRSGTENVPAIIGMATALEESINISTSNVVSIRNNIIHELLKIDGAVLNGSVENRLPNNINISFEDIDGEVLVYMLGEKGICASSGSACNSKNGEPSHVLIALGRNESLANGSLRLTISNDINLYESLYIIETVKDTVNSIRKMKG